MRKIVLLLGLVLVCLLGITYKLFDELNYVNNFLGNRYGLIVRYAHHDLVDRKTDLVVQSDLYFVEEFDQKLITVSDVGIIVFDSSGNQLLNLLPSPSSEELNSYLSMQNLNSKDLESIREVLCPNQYSDLHDRQTFIRYPYLISVLRPGLWDVHNNVQLASLGKNYRLGDDYYLVSDEKILKIDLKKNIIYICYTDDSDSTKYNTDREVRDKDFAKLVSIYGNNIIRLDNLLEFSSKDRKVIERLSL